MRIFRKNAKTLFAVGIAISTAMLLILQGHAQAQSYMSINKLALNKNLIESKLKGQLLAETPLIRNMPNHPLHTGTSLGVSSDRSDILAYTEGYSVISFFPVSEKEMASAMSYTYRYADELSAKSAGASLRRYLKGMPPASEVSLGTPTVDGKGSSFTDEGTFQMFSKDGQTVNQWSVMVKGDLVVLLNIEGSMESAPALTISTNSLKTQLVSQ